MTVPRLSVVSAARDDGYGERFDERFLMHIASINEFARGFDAPLEHVVVDWNPVAGAPLLDLASRVPPAAGVERRVIAAAGEDVAVRAERAGRPFVEAAAKNFGIARTKSPWTCVCNSDVALTFELGTAVRALWAAEALPAVFIRADRLDVAPAPDTDLLPLSHVGSALPFARILHRRHGTGAADVASPAVAGLVDSAVRELASAPRASDLDLGAGFLCVDQHGPTAGLHTNGAGDFLIAPTDALRFVGGVPDDLGITTHLDSLLVAALHGRARLTQVILRWPAIVVHVDHDREEGYGTGSLPFTSVAGAFHDLLEGRPVSRASVGPQLVPSHATTVPPLPALRTHDHWEGAELHGGPPWQLVTSSVPWGYSAEIAWNPREPAEGDTWLEVEVTCLRGAVGIGALVDDAIVREVVVRSSDGRRVVALPIDRRGGVVAMLRSTEVGLSHAEVHSLEARAS